MIRFGRRLSAASAKIHANVFHLFRKFKYVAGENGVLPFKFGETLNQQVHVLAGNTRRRERKAGRFRQFFTNGVETLRVVHALPPSGIMEEAYNFGPLLGTYGKVR